MHRYQKMPMKYTKLADNNTYRGVYTCLTLAAGSAQIWEQRDGLYMLEMTGEYVFRRFNDTLFTQITGNLDFAKFIIAETIPFYLSMNKQA